MYKIFVYFQNKEELIHEFAIAYIVNPTFNVNKVFKEKVEEFMNDTSGTTTQPSIKHAI